MGVGDFLEFAVPGLAGAFFIPDFIDRDVEISLCNECVGEGGSKRGFISGQMGPAVTMYTHARLKEEIPPELGKYVEYLHQKRVFEKSPYQISVNCYSNKNLGMVPHKDGAGTFGSILTLGSPVVLHFWHRPSPDSQVKKTMVFMRKDEHDNSPLSDFEVPHLPDVSLYLAQRSLLLLSKESFVDYVHGIFPTDNAINTRKYFK